MGENNKNNVLPLSQEEAEVMADTLLTVAKTDNGTTVIYSGTHKVHGAVHIVISPIGESYLLLPFEPQNF